MASRGLPVSAWLRVIVLVAGAVLAAALAACGTADQAGPGGATPASQGSRTGTRTPSAGAPAGGGTSATARAHVAAAGDAPPGFWYGTDSFAMAVTGTGPYNEPVIGVSYGGYVGMAGNWAHWQGCGGDLVWSAANASEAAANRSTYRKGIGTAVYWFMAGPGVDPNYDGRVAEARAWGQQQAGRALADIGSSVTYPVIWMDVELPGDAPRFTPAQDNGWNAVYTAPCSGQVKTQHIDPAVDRGVIDGFAGYLTAHSSYQAGVYSAPPVWTAIFGTGSAAQIPGLYEWTYTGNTSSLARHPAAWCLKNSSTCAHFFGGQHATGSTALMWQWSGGGGTSNGYGDFDQIDGARTP